MGQDNLLSKHEAQGVGSFMGCQHLLLCAPDSRYTSLFTLHRRMICHRCETQGMEEWARLQAGQGN